MPFNGDMIAAEVKAALEEAAIATGRNKPLTGLLIQDPPVDENVYPPVPIGEPAEYAITGLFSKYEPADIDGRGILSTDVRILIAAHGLEAVPTQNDRIEIDGEVFYIENTPSLRPGGIAFMYDVQARKR